MNTYNTMNEVSGILREKGTLEAKDFPHHFATRCLKLEKLTGAINSEMKLMLCARRYRSRLHLSRSILTGQYSEVAVILREIAEETANGMEEDIEVARYLERALRAHCEAAAEAAFFVWRDQSGKLQIEISGPNIIGAGREIAEVVASLEKTRGIRLGAPEYSVEEVDRVRISEAEMFSVKIGVAAHKRKGSSVSGDSSTYFKTEDGRLFILLSDGMGSGREAAIESGSVVRLTEKFLKAGIEPVTTLQTVAQALLLRNLEEGGFATIDLMELNLAVGECRFYKQGAAPTFMKNGRKVRSYVGKAFPPGIGPEEYPADLPILQLEGGETLIMLSDGAYGPTGDIWLGEMLDEFPEESPKEIALRVAGEASLRSDGKDDVTVIAMKIQRNK